MFDNPIRFKVYKMTNLWADIPNSRAGLPLEVFLYLPRCSRPGTGKAVASMNIIKASMEVDTT